MNEKIKELALQAGGSHYPDVGGKTLEKFAELLLKECVQQADNEMSRFHNMNEDDCAFAMENYITLIKEHFGVEE